MGMTQMTQEATAVLNHIAKVMKRKDAKTYNWPGAPVAHFGTDEMPLIRAMVAAGVVTLAERPKANPEYTATFICLPA
jgi:hypothetical protein